MFTNEGLLSETCHLLPIRLHTSRQKQPPTNFHSAKCSLACYHGCQHPMVLLLILLEHQVRRFTAPGHFIPSCVIVPACARALILHKIRQKDVHSDRKLRPSFTVWISDMIWFKRTMFCFAKSFLWIIYSPVCRDLVGKENHSKYCKCCWKRNFNKSKFMFLKSCFVMQRVSKKMQKIIVVWCLGKENWSHTSE